ncbi:NUDIX hydrolase [Histomonas meleagridis]|uniref:NUDIX hydrolase n=1 Tax=Histomonas meleagridis TaxID=135588 RepID=UPI003559B25F|nr:NUDIX hydrolase [Histomonas meleagridis]KAH0802888.1 NUDIX hydrolase [Histomonas meleagridis]
MQKYIADIEKYQPVSEQETKDKEVILKYIHDFDNILYRTNEYAHITSSSWIVNKERTKCLLVYHNIYDAWTWTGGHADGDPDLLAVAIREANEETGIHATPLSNDIMCIDVLPVWGHKKNGKWVSSHEHLSIAYILEADENEEIRKKEDENKGVKWVPIEEVLDVCKEKEMHYVYAKLNERIKQFPPK